MRQLATHSISGVDLWLQPALPHRDLRGFELPCRSMDQASGSSQWIKSVDQGFSRSRMDRQGHSFPLFETLRMDGDRFDPYNFPVLQLCLFSTGYGNSTEQVFFGLRGTFGALRHISLLY